MAITACQGPSGTQTLRVRPHAAPDCSHTLPCLSSRACAGSAARACHLRCVIPDKLSGAISMAPNSSVGKSSIIITTSGPSTSLKLSASASLPQVRRALRLRASCALGLQCGLEGVGTLINSIKARGSKLAPPFGHDMMFTEACPCRRRRAALLPTAYQKLSPGVRNSDQGVQAPPRMQAACSCTTP